MPFVMPSLLLTTLTPRHRRTGTVLFRELRSVARIFAGIFYPLLVRKSSGFARILHDFVLPQNDYLTNSMGLHRPPPPPPLDSYTYAVLCASPRITERIHYPFCICSSQGIYSLSNSITKISRILRWRLYSNTQRRHCMAFGSGDLGGPALNFMMKCNDVICKELPA